MSKSCNTLHVISLGCTKNLVDSEVMLGALKDYELVDDVALADVIIINTCGFIQSAKEESISTILQVHKERKKDSILVASGCLSQRYSSELKQMIPEIDIITGVGDYHQIDEVLRRKKGFLSKNTFLVNETQPRVITGSNLHAYIKISEGCNQNCSFCAIPSFKGRLVSRDIDSILREIEQLTSKGFKDFTFIAQDSSSYMRDLGRKNGLIELINALDKQNLAVSARFLYLYPSTTTFELIDAIAQSRIFQNYFDIPIQHISEKMLKIMRRGCNQKDHERLLEYMRKIPQSFVRSTVIIGHPQESETDFLQLCDFIEHFKFDRLNIFAFSSEEGTLAHSMNEKIPQKTIHSRIKYLDNIWQSCQDKILNAMKGKRMNMILEGKSEVSEHFYSARPISWAPQVDGEILIYDLEDGVSPNLNSGYCHGVVTDIKDGLILGKILGD